MNLAETQRIVSAGTRLLRANYQRLPYPAKLNFAVTYLCQYKCTTCNIWKKKPTNELSTDEILEFVKRNRKFSWVDITGGEIFIRKDISDLLQAIAVDWNRMAILHFPTNGFQTEKILKVVEVLAPRLKARLVITVSLDGFESLNDQIRGIKGGYKRQMETFRALRKIKGVQTVLGMTLSESNLGEFESTFRGCQKESPGLGIKDFHLNVMQLSGHYYSNEDLAQLSPNNSRAIAELEKYKQLRGPALTPSALLENVFKNNLKKFLTTGTTPMKCHALRSGCFVDPWGTVFPCITWSRPLGSLRDTNMDLEPIWQSTTTRETQAQIWKGNCPQCWTACEAYQSILGNLLRGNKTEHSRPKSEEQARTASSNSDKTS